MKDPLPAGAPFGLRLTVDMPSETHLSAGKLKKLIDGVVSAFQVHTSSPEAALRIAHPLGIQAEEVATALEDPTLAVLGSSEKPVGLTTADVQWNPDDTRLVAAEVIVQARALSVWTISGRLFEVNSENMSGKALELSPIGPAGRDVQTSWVEAARPG